MFTGETTGGQSQSSFSDGVRRRLEKVVDGIAILRNYQNGGQDVFAGSIGLESADASGMVFIEAPETIQEYAIKMPASAPVADEILKAGSISSGTASMEWATPLYDGEPITLPDGSSGSPALTFENASGTGFYYDGANGMKVVEGVSGQDVIIVNDFFNMPVLKFASFVMEFLGEFSWIAIATAFEMKNYTNAKGAEFWLYEASDNGNDILTIACPADVLNPYTLTLPDDAPGGDRVMVADSNGDCTFDDVGDALMLMMYASSDDGGGSSIRTVDFDTEMYSRSGFSHSVSGGEITISTPGKYLIQADLTADADSGTRTEVECVLQHDTGSGMSDIAGSEGWIYCRTSATGGRTTATIRAVVDVSSGDTIRARMDPSAGGATGVGGANRISFTKIR